MNAGLPLRPAVLVRVFGGGAAVPGLRDRRLCSGFFQKGETLEELAGLAVHDLGREGGKLVVSVRLVPAGNAQTGSPEAIRFGAEFPLVGDFNNDKVRMLDPVRDQAGTFSLDDRVSSLDGALGEREVTAGDAVDVGGGLRWFGLWTP